MKKSNDTIKIYVWEFPVRLTHWINFFCILILSLTGYYMGNPMDHSIFSKQYIFSLIRFTHFVAAYAFLMSFIIRLYWSLAGNEHANMKQWIPLTRGQMKTLLNDIRHHLVLDIKATSKIGHTALGAFVFFILQIIFCFALISGFAMYSTKHPGEYMRVLGEWVQNTVPVDRVKSYHTMVMYTFLVFVPIHLFMSLMNHIKLKNRLIGSIISGHKMIHEDYEKSPSSK
ncbi:MAG: Ni/Fe-hydrogenase, b-type cytochrome subunit [Nitrospiraceae bacterium]|nr:MAG: Ni/Fe-hydrogenase, b-type cytochrome subunit [Nitrospiraceae bacterium]